MGRRAQAAGVLRAAGKRHLPQQGRHARQDQHDVAAGEEGARRRDGIPAHQSSARLPDLRSGRRVRSAGPGDGLWPRELPSLQGKQARRRRQIYGPADQDDHDPLHPVHTLRALRDGGDGRSRSRRHGPRRGYGNHDLSREGVRIRTLGQRGRSLPGGCADVETLCVQCALVGAGEDRIHRRDGRAGLQHPRRHARAAGDARAPASQRGGQRRVDFRQDAARL